MIDKKELANSYQIIAEELLSYGSVRSQTIQKFDGKYYPASAHQCEGSWFFLVREGADKYLVGTSNSNIDPDFQGANFTKHGINIRVGELTAENSQFIQTRFPFTKPTFDLTADVSMGFGDRLGIATPGHIRSVRNTQVFPVFAQQSMREMTFTNRRFSDVIGDAAWGTFQEDYQKGFAADGDHLKSLEDIQNALAAGASMITLDCSEHINYSALTLEGKELNNAYTRRIGIQKESLESKFLSSANEVGGFSLTYSPEEWQRVYLTYADMLDFVSGIYYGAKFDQNPNLAFEVSIDEIPNPTSAKEHYFIGSELVQRGLKIYSVAPRFVGEFQKAIDYIGDLEEFRSSLEQHIAIARAFGYKLSVHSGSDKFRIFPSLNEISNGHFHLKTAGTSWVEALNVISQIEPDFFRRLHRSALANLESAKKYYHITENIAHIPKLETLEDEELPILFDNADARQLLHTTYGFMLNEIPEIGQESLRDGIYRILNTHEDAYYGGLKAHFDHHLKELGQL